MFTILCQYSTKEVMLHCPNCNHSLTPLTVTTDSHGRMEIDHCYFCGGAWFDHYEINRLPMRDAIYLSRMASKEDLLKTQGSNKCPKDGNPLTQTAGESIPPDVTVLSCKTCGGNFVAKSELLTLKKAQKIKVDYFKTWKIPLPALSTVLIPGLLLFIATAGVFLTVRNVQQAQEARIKAKELIGVPTIVVSERNSVLVSFSTNVPVLASIVYQGTSEKEPHTIPVSTKKQTQHTTTLQNLEPKTTYTLKIYVEEIPEQIISSPTYSFTTN